MHAWYFFIFNLAIHDHSKHFSFSSAIVIFRRVNGSDHIENSLAFAEALKISEFYLTVLRSDSGPIYYSCENDVLCHKVHKDIRIIAESSDNECIGNYIDPACDIKLGLHKFLRKKLERLISIMLGFPANGGKSPIFAVCR